MSSSKRYFQLSQDILLEYTFSSTSEMLNQEGESRYMYDMKPNGVSGSKSIISIVDDGYNGSKNVYINSKFTTSNNAFASNIDYPNGFVLPSNSSESKFKKCAIGRNSSYSLVSDSKLKETKIEAFESESGNTDVSDIVFDRFTIHFTSKNYFGSYDSIIIRAHVYDKVKNKLCLFSQIIKRTDNVIINENPILVNQKLYTTYLNFEMPSPSALVSIDNQEERSLMEALGGENGVMEDTPIIFTIYGVKATLKDGDNESYNVEKLNAVYVPITDKFDEIEIVIKESSDGDYFEIYPCVDGGEISFSDYMANISYGRLDTYIVFHDLTLTEHYIDSQNRDMDKISHREQYIVNVSNEDGTINEDGLENIMYYRPIVTENRSCWFTIKDQMKILNTLDNTTIVKEARLDYGNRSSENSSNENPMKYGKKLSRIYLGEIPSIVRVYNKRQDIDTDLIKITNTGANVKIENHQHPISGLVECINVGVSIEQVSLDSIEM